MTAIAGPMDAATLLYSVLPVERMFGFARLHGRLTYRVRREQRSRVRANLASVFGATKSARELDVLTEQFFEYKSARGLLLALAPRLSADELELLLAIEGLEHLDAALQKGRGVILLGSHLNSICLFLVTILLRARGYDARVALPKPGEPAPVTTTGRALARLFETRPLTHLLGAFYAQFNIRPIVRALAENAIVVQTGDGLHSAKFVDVEFLGRTLPFPTGMMSVAQATGAAVVPIFQVGAPPNRMRTVIEEPSTVAGGDEAEAALEHAVAAYAARLEQHVRDNIPCWEHWLIEDTLDTIASWPDRPLEERYEV